MWSTRILALVLLLCAVCLSVQNEVYDYDYDYDSEFENDFSFDNATEIQNSTLVYGDVDAGDFIYYSFRVNNSTSFLVNITDLEGDTELYIGHGYFPTRENYTFAAINETKSVFAYNATKGTYIIGVYGYTNASYYLESTIFGRGNKTVEELRENAPVRRWISHTYQYYSFEVRHNSTNVFLEFNCTFGDADLFLSSFGVPSMEDHEWSLVSSHHERETLEIFDAFPGTYYVAVLGHNLTRSYYSLEYYTSSANGTFTPLSFYSPHNSTVEWNKYEFYSIFVPYNHSIESFTVKVHSYWGDADLYISTHGVPTREDHQWSSATARDDNVTISNRDASFNRTFYIGVYGFSTAAYSIVVTTDNHNGTEEIYEYEVIYEHLGVNETKYYYFFPDGAFKLSMDVLQGNASLLVSSKPRPSWTSYDYMLYGNDSVVVINGTGAGRAVYLALYSTFWTSAEVSFSFENVESNVTKELPLDYWITGNVSTHAFDYYQLRVSNASANLTIQVASAFNRTDNHTASDPDLYISTLGLPTLTNYQWYSRVSGNDTIVIDLSKLRNHTGLVFYIGVYGYHAGEYSIRASLSSNVTVAWLADGQKVVDTVDSAAYKYYSFYYSYRNATGFSVFLTQLNTGDADLYIATRYLPTTNHYDYRSTKVGSDNITVGQILYEGPVYIGVFGYSASVYSLVAHLDHSSGKNETEIRSGQSISGFVNSTAYFSFNTSSATRGAFTVHLNISTGDADLYISNLEYPSPTNYLWASTSIGDDEIRVNASVYQRLHVAIVGNGPAYYTLSLSLNSTSPPPSPSPSPSSSPPSPSSPSSSGHPPPSDNTVIIIMAIVIAVMSVVIVVLVVTFVLAMRRRRVYNSGMEGLLVNTAN